MRVYLAAPAQLYQYHTPFQARRLLISFVKMSWGVEKFQLALDNAKPTHGYCVDSGAHVWLSMFFKKQEKPPMAKVEQTIERFLPMVQQLSGDPQFVVDLDIQRIYGLPVIDGWRKTIWQPFERASGIRVCYVWHPSDGEARWEELLADPDVHYLGMGSSFKMMPVEAWARLVYRAYQAGKPVHGFAKINAKYLMKVPFYSVDSTSWASGSFFGTVPHFNATTGAINQRSVGDKARQNVGAAAVLTRLAVTAQGKIKADLLQRGAFIGKDYQSFYQNGVDQYTRFEAWFTAYWKARGVDWDAQLARHGNLGPPDSLDPR
jgi:hypothetical protein